MKQNLALVLFAVVLGGVLARECFPRTIEILSAPVIQTVYDTVYDTVRVPLLPPKLPQQPNYVLRVTTNLAPVVPTYAIERPNLWPILNATIGGSRGDTSRMTTINLSSGQTATSLVWTAGPLTGVWADTTPKPRIVFGNYSPRKGLSLWTKLKWGGIGYGVRTVQDLAGLSPACH